METPLAHRVIPALEAVVSRILPGATLLSAAPFGVDDAEVVDPATTKGLGYGVPLRLRVREASGAELTLVFHTAQPDQFGHDRRADRAAELLLSFDRFEQIPGHVRALDVGAIAKNGRELISLRDAGEFYLVTSFAEGHLYADELRRIAQRGVATADEIAHAEALARHLVTIHSQKLDDPRVYQRAIRDLVGSGEGIFGLLDAYAPDVPGAPPERLMALERSLTAWRWRLKPRTARLCRTHGDYHPFNVVISDAGEVALLDASRGCAGDPADDVTCMAINFVFFAVEHPGTWATAFRDLWHRFWRVYLEASADLELYEVCAPFLAWRGLVVANPVWYPHVDGGARDRVLSLVERSLAAERFDPAFADEVFA
ncbi:MAG: aminoglycoside phosphotransferase family protein [Polyangiaceae bacterium]|nr:aminoglycoside phosphotransferase family protein [Polyangiaceae bacterium]